MNTKQHAQHGLLMEMILSVPRLALLALPVVLYVASIWVIFAEYQPGTMIHDLSFVVFVVETVLLLLALSVSVD